MSDRPTSPTDEQDDATLALLRVALASDEPVPDRLHRAALDAFAFRDLDAALAALVTDELAGVRDAASSALVFEADVAELSVDIVEDRATGQVAPPAACPGRVEAADGVVVEFTTDTLGRFTVDVPPGPVRITVEHPDGRFHTDWFRR